jgi:hypothetical protein
MNIEGLTELFKSLGMAAIKRSPEGCEQTVLRRFQSHFGLAPSTCANVWILLQDNIPANYRHEHLLYALLFLKNYQTEHQNSALFSVDEKTFRKYQWIFVNLISTKLNVVREF